MAKVATAVFPTPHREVVKRHGFTAQTVPPPSHKDHHPRPGHSHVSSRLFQQPPNDSPQFRSQPPTTFSDCYRATRPHLKALSIPFAHYTPAAIQRQPFQPLRQASLILLFSRSLSSFLKVISSELSLLTCFSITALSWPPSQ